MELDRELLDTLICPKCKGELEITPDGGELRCAACRLSFRIDDGIPILLLDEASPYE